ncbi:MAG TPA: serine/threonine-protein kinase [Leptolyngbyaceae cyanobacterium]
MLCDRYRPIKLIGQGGFGRTFLAVDEKTSPPQRCVIKQELRGSFSAADAGDKRFQEEAERLRELGEHPQIPKLLDYFEGISSQYLIQEYVPGPNLDQLLAQQVPFDEQRVRHLLSEILPVLQFVHSHQVIHRDIKPANLIVSPQFSQWVLVDFGASKHVNQVSLLEKTGTVIGSAGYAAPEQALGKATFASDLYSLGVTCIHALTGMHPFDLYSTSEDRWAWRTYVQAPVSLKLARILDQMLARGLRERYVTADAVLADLNWVPQLGNPPSKRSTFLRWPKKQPKQRPSPPAITPATGSWQLVRTINQPGGVVNSLAVSPNGRAIATGSTDHTVRLWDLSNGELVHTFTKRWGVFGSGHQDKVVAVTFSPDGGVLYSASRDGVIKGWDLATYEAPFDLNNSSWETAALSLTPDGETLITAGGEGKIQLWDIPSCQLRATLIHHQDWVSSLALSPDGQMLISGSWDCTLRSWHLPTGRLLNTLTAPVNRITAVTCHPKSRHIYSGDSKGNIQIWQLEKTLSVSLLSQHQAAVTAIAISPNGRWLSTGSADSDLQIWDLKSQSQLDPLNHSWGIQATVFAPNSPTLISSSADETIRVWQWVGR